MQLVSGKLFPADVPSSDRQQCGQNTEMLIRKYVWHGQYTSACYIAAFFARRG